MHYGLWDLQGFWAPKKKQNTMYMSVRPGGAWPIYCQSDGTYGYCERYLVIQIIEL